MPALRLVALAAVLLAAPQLAEAQVDPCAAGKFFTAGKCTAQCGVPCAATGVETVGDKTKDSICGPSTCGPGLFYTPASGATPSTCTACPAGTFSSAKDASQSCTPHCSAVCAANGLKTAGDATKDAVCAPASCPKGEFWTAKKDGVVASCTKCGSGRFNDQNTAGATEKFTKCALLNACSASGVTTAGDATQDAVCGPTVCVAGEYLTVKSTSAAAKCSPCTAGTNFKAGTNAGTSCTALQACSTYGVLASGRGSRSRDNVCGPSKCGKGFKHVAKSGDTASSCTPCAVETFNAADDTSSTCAAWKTSCSNGILTEGDLTKDHVCVSSPLTGCKINEFWTAAASSTVAAYCTRCPAGKYLEHSGTGVHTTTTCTAHGTDPDGPTACTAAVGVVSATVGASNAFVAGANAWTTAGYAVGDVVTVTATSPGGCAAIGTATSKEFTITDTSTANTELRVTADSIVAIESGSGRCVISKPARGAVTNGHCCPPGFTANAGNSACVACGSGTFKAGYTKAAVVCEAHTTSSAGRVVLTSVDNTQWDNEFGKLVVGDATKDNVGGKKSCPKGEYWTAATGDKLGANAAKCTKCPVGTFQPNSNSQSTSCTPKRVCCARTGTKADIVIATPAAIKAVSAVTVAAKTLTTTVTGWLARGFKVGDRITLSHKAGSICPPIEAANTGKTLDLTVEHLFLGTDELVMVVKEGRDLFTANNGGNLVCEISQTYTEADPRQDRVCAPAGCPAGQGYGASTPSTCTACVLGNTFSSTAGATACSAIEPCTTYGIATPATLTTDSVCGPSTCVAGEAFTAKSAGTPATLKASSCAACAGGRFSAQDDRLSCAAHQACSTEGVKTAGTATTDAVCGATQCAAGQFFTAKSGATAATCTACAAGKYNTKTDPGTTTAHTSCAAHDQCAATGVATPGTALANAVCGVAKCPAKQGFVAKSGSTAAKCELCPSGKFSAADDNKPCAVCKAGTAECCDAGFSWSATAGGTCTACASCGTFSVGRNDDTYCAKHATCGATGVATEGDATRNSVCGPTTCGKGEYFTAKDHAAPSQCTTCPAGQYNDADDASTGCKAHCLADCSAAAGVVAGGATEDSACGPSECPAGQFYTDRTGSSPSLCTACESGKFEAETGTGTSCASHKSCGTTGVKTAGIAAVDNVCGPATCSAGYFYTAKSGSTASKCTACAAGKYLGTGNSNREMHTTTSCAAFADCSTEGVMTAGSAFANQVCGPVGKDGASANCPAGFGKTGKSGSTASYCTACVAGTSSQAGTFNANVDANACANHKACTGAGADGGGVKTPGTASADAVCVGVTATDGTVVVGCFANNYFTSASNGRRAFCTRCPVGKYLINTKEGPGSPGSQKAVQVTIPATDNQIVRASGSWATDGYVAGQVIRLTHANTIAPAADPTSTTKLSCLAIGADSYGDYIVADTAVGADAKVLGVTATHPTSLTDPSTAGTCLVSPAQHTLGSDKCYAVGKGSDGSTECLAAGDSATVVTAATTANNRWTTTSNGASWANGGWKVGQTLRVSHKSFTGGVGSCLAIPAAPVLDGTAGATKATREWKATTSWAAMGFKTGSILRVSHKTGTECTAITQTAGASMDFIVADVGWKTTGGAAANVNYLRTFDAATTRGIRPQTASHAIVADMGDGTKCHIQPALPYHDYSVETVGDTAANFLKTTVAPTADLTGAGKCVVTRVADNTQAGADRCCGAGRHVNTAGTGCVPCPPLSYKAGLTHNTHQCEPHSKITMSAAGGTQANTKTGGVGVQCPKNTGNLLDDCDSARGIPGTEHTLFGATDGYLVVGDATKDNIGGKVKCPSGQHRLAAVATTARRSFAHGDKEGPNAATCVACAPGKFVVQGTNGVSGLTAGTTASCAAFITKCCGTSNDVGGVKTAGDATKNAVCSKVETCTKGLAFTAAAGVGSSPWVSTAAARCSACASGRFTTTAPVVASATATSKTFTSVISWDLAGYKVGDSLTVMHKAGTTSCEAIGTHYNRKTFTVASITTTSLVVKETVAANEATSGDCVFATPTCKAHRTCDAAATGGDGNSVHGVRKAGTSTVDAECGTALCDAGQYFTAKSGTSGTQCTPCESGKFKVGTNAVTSCTTISSCSVTGVTTVGSATNNAVCGPVTCPAGFRYTAKNGNTASFCTACSSGSFSDKDDAATSCTTHTDCSATLKKVTGTTTRDNTCGPTKCPPGQGYTGKDAGSNTPSRCTACTSCQFNSADDTSVCATRAACAGAGVATPGSTTTNNQCGPSACPAGQYFTAKSGDTPSKCSACATGKFLAAVDATVKCNDHNKCAATGKLTDGTAKADAVCAPATCGKTFGLVAKSSTSPNKCEACADGKFSAADDGQPCAACAEDASQCCDAGKKWVPKDGATAAKCEDCPTGEFKVGRNDAQACAKVNACAATGVKTPGDAKKNAVCAPAKCAQGQYFTAKDGTTVAKCTSCASGKFNGADDASTQCNDYNKCTDKGTVVAGNATHDATCSTVTKCGKGKVFSAKTNTTAAKCSDCPAGTFNDADDASTACKAQCTLACGDKGVTPGDKTKGATCGVSNCPKGSFYTAKKDTKPTQPASCTACGSGKFNSAVDQSTSCSAVNACILAGTKTKAPSDRTKDAVCLPEPATITVNAVKLDAAGKKKALDDIAKSISAAGANTTVPKVKVRTDVAMTGIAVADIAEGSAARAQFIKDVEAAIFQKTGLAMKVVFIAATTGRRVLGATERRQLAEGVKVSMAAEVPKSVAADAASIIKTAKDEGGSISVKVGSKTAGADLSKMSAVKVTEDKAIDCEGTLGKCKSTCKQTYTISTPRNGAGKECPHTDLAEVSCGTACKQVSYSYGIDVLYSKITAMSSTDVAGFKTALAADLDAHLLTECKATDGCDATCQAACTSATTVGALSAISRRRQLQVGTGDTSARATTAGDKVTSTSVNAALTKEVSLANAGAKVGSAGLKSTGKVAVDAPAGGGGGGGGGTTTQVPGKVAGATPVATSFALLCGAVVALLLQ